MKLLNGSLAICAMVLSVSLVMATGAGAAMNQPPRPTTPGYAGAKNRKTVDDATLKRTAAYVKVRHITLETRRVLSRTNDTNKKHQIIRQAEMKEIAAVKAQGIQPRQYNQVILMVKNNDQLRHKFLSYVRQAQGLSGQSM